MRILLANYRYFVSGGPERYMFNVIDGLTARGHEIVPFSVRYKRNRPTPYDRYFVRPLGSEEEVLFREQRLTPGSMKRTLARLFYATDVEKAVLRAASDTQPQVAYVLHYLRKLSPSLLVGLKKAGLPIVVRLSDFAMVCPQAHCLRDGLPCDLCVKGDLWPSIRYRCLQDSYAASLLNALATWYHRARGFFDLVDVFVTSTEFMHGMMLQAGFAPQRLRFIPTFVDGTVFYPSSGFVKGDHIAFVGRLEETKGLHVLLDALASLSRRRPDLDLHLKVAGGGDGSYAALIQQKVVDAELGDAVQFLGWLDVNELATLVRTSRLTVVPSLWYENLPNAILESLASGTPVLASDLGSLSECVIDGQTGYHFSVGEPDSLAATIEYCLDHPAELAAMSRQARRAAEDLYSVERHLNALEELFDEVTHQEKDRERVRKSHAA